MNKKICYCTGTTEGLNNCTMCGDDCCGPVTDDDDKLMTDLFKSLPKITDKEKLLIRNAMIDFRRTPTDLLKQLQRTLRMKK